LDLKRRKCIFTVFTLLKDKGVSYFSIWHNKDFTFIHFGNIMLEKLFSNHQKYSPHNAFGISVVIISLAVFQLKVSEVNIQLALSHETSAAIHNTTVMCVYKSWVTMLERDISECY